MTLITHKEMVEHVSSTMHVFRGEKYRLLRSTKIQPNGKCDRNEPLTVHQMNDHGQTHSGKKNAGGVDNQAHILSPSWYSHEVRQSKSKRMDRNPGWIGGGTFTPVKNPFAKEEIHAWEKTKKI